MMDKKFSRKIISFGTVVECVMGAEPIRRNEQDSLIRAILILIRFVRHQDIARVVSLRQVITMSCMVCVVPYLVELVFEPDLCVLDCGIVLIQDPEKMAR